MKQMCASGERAIVCEKGKICKVAGSFLFPPIAPLEPKDVRDRQQEGPRSPVATFLSPDGLTIPGPKFKSFLVDCYFQQLGCHPQP